MESVLRESSVTQEEQKPVTSAPSLPSPSGGIQVVPLQSSPETTVLEVINSVAKEMHLTPFEEKRIEDLLFRGYKVTFLDRLEEKIKELDMSLPISLPTNNTFGIMMGRNNSDTGLITIHTGLDGDEIFKVLSWEMSKSGQHFLYSMRHTQSPLD